MAVMRRDRMTELAEAVCPEFGVSDRQMTRLTLTLDWQDGLPKLEIERIPDQDSGEHGALRRFVEDCRDGQASLGELYGGTPSAYVVMEKLGDYERRVSFSTKDEVLEFVEGRCDDRTDRAVQEVDPPPGAAAAKR